MLKLSYQQAISNRWIYRVKRNADDEVTCYEVRLVIRGFNQSEGIDYTETFSPVASIQNKQS